MVVRSRFGGNLYRAVQWRGDYKEIVREFLHDGEVVGNRAPCKYNYWLVRPYEARSAAPTPVRAYHPLAYWALFKVF